MADIVNLQDRMQAKWRAQGETTFMQCGCGAETGLLPVILHDAGAPLVVALVCPECESEVAVNAGRLVMEGA